MTEGGYGLMAEVYDRLNREVAYGRFADYYEACFRAYGKPGLRSVLDLGCGTGSVTLELAKRGYDLIGVDNSPEMLAVASERARQAGTDGAILWLLQDMTSFDLYGTVEATVCCLDGINHLWRKGAAEACFARVHLFSEPGALFLFDVNTPWKFREQFAGRDYVLEEPGALLTWRNEFHPAAGTCDFCLTLFRERPDGTYEREDAVQKERCFTEAQLRRMLTRTGFEVLGVFSGEGREAPGPGADRWQIAARVIK